MKRRLPAWAAATAAACLLALPGTRARGEELGPELVARTEPLSPEAERAKLKLPAGFEAQLVAAEPAIQKPMNLAFDRHGRVWVTDTVEYPFPAKDGERGRDTVKVLEDADGDGRAEKVTLFADDLNIPIGLLPTEDGAMVYSIARDHKQGAQIYRFVDKDGDGRADERRTLYAPFGFRDTHGDQNGFRHWLDGWVYACHGFSNDSEPKGADGHGIRMNSGNTYRFRGDGSRVEQVTFGQVNPFGLCFDPLGNIYTADCHSQPGYLLLPGAFYPSFGKPHDGLGFGPTLMEHDHGSTAISGIVYYAAGHFPAEWRDTLFIGNVVTNRINHDRLDRRGSTLKAVIQPDFLASEDPWFRPVDLRLGPDGALYVADFYNRIIGHYEVPLTHPGRDRDRGRIWRIVYRGKGGAGPPPYRPIADYAGASTGELVKALGHENLEVRTEATHELVRRRGPEVLELAHRALGSPVPWARAHALWVLERLGSLDSKAIEAAAGDPDALVRVHAQRVLSGRGSLSDAERALALAALADPDGTVKRIACEALGRHPRSDHLAPLLALRKAAPAEDALLVHRTRMSLRDQLRLPGIWEKVAALSGEDQALVAEVTPGVHTGESAAFLLGLLEKDALKTGSASERVQYAARHLAEGEIERLHRFVRGHAGDLDRRARLLHALHRGTEERGGKLGEAMLGHARELAAELLAAGEPGKVRAGIELARALKLSGLEERLAGLARGKPEPEDCRRLCMEALVAIDPAGQAGLLREVLTDSSESFGLREHAANQLGNIRQPEALDALAAGLQVAPLRLGRRIAAAMARSPEGAERLLAEVESGKAAPRLLKEREAEGRLSRSQAPGVRERLAKLIEGLQELDEGVEKLIGARKQGFGKVKPDPERGAAVFEKSCSSCHKLGEKGKKLGPELAGIGSRGLDRLLEDVLDPSRNVDKAFAATVVITRQNLVHTGLFLSDEGEVVVLADAEGREVRIPKREVKSREVTPLSPMPSNAGETIPEADFHHLMGYLLSQRATR